MISIKDYTPEFIRNQRAEVQSEEERCGIPQENRIINLHPMTYKEAIHLAWEVLEEKRKEVESDVNRPEGSVNQYEDAIALLSNLFLRDII